MRDKKLDKLKSALSKKFALTTGSERKFGAHSAA